MGNKTAHKEGKEEKKESERERSKQIRQKKKILAFAHASNTKELFNYVRLGGKYAFFLSRLVSAILMLIS